MMKKIILIILICFSSTSVLKADFLAPLIRVSYDFNLGYTTSIGLSWNKIEGGEIGAGAYILYSFSNKGIIKRGLLNNIIHRRNFSAGVYGGLGIASFRIGINRMIINDIIDKNDDYLVNNTSFDRLHSRLFIQESGSYWGIEASPQMFLFNGCAGIVFTPKQPKLNLSIGLGIF